MPKRFEARKSILAGAHFDWDVLDHERKNAIPVVGRKIAMNLAKALNDGTQTTDHYITTPELYPEEN